MCEPATLALASFAVNTASTLSQFQAQTQQAEAQDAIFEQNRLNAYQSMRDEYLGLQARQVQEQEASSQKIQERKRQEMEELATASVSSGEAGITGLTVERILRDTGAVASRDISTIEQNRDWTIEQLNREKAGVAAKTSSRVNSVSTGVYPNKWATAFKIGGATINHLAKIKE